MHFKNKYFYLLIILSLLISADSFSQKSDYEMSAIAFYNVENLFHPEHDEGKYDQDFTPDGSYRYTEAIYKKKLQNMAFALSQIAIEKVPQGSAVIGLAEVENEKVLVDLIAEPALKDRQLRFVHFESPDARGIDNALLYDPRYFKVLGAQALPVVLMENGKRSYTRDVLYVTGRLMQDTIHILVNHWPSRVGGEAASAWRRAVAAEVNKKVIDSLTQLNPNAKVIMMGDLNDDPISPSMTKVLGAKGDKKTIKEGDIYNPWMSFYKKGIGTLGYGDSWNLFDQIVLTYGFLNPENKGWQYYKAEVFNKKFLITPFGRYKGYPHRSFSGTTWIDGYSDHFPTIIYLIKKK